jgi:uncharacterized protein
VVDELLRVLALTHFATDTALLAGVVAVVLVGLSKGGLGGAFALMGVPVLALVMPPLQAAAVLLPILLVMDAVSLWAWRGHCHWRVLWTLLPGALAGTAVGWWAAAVTSEALVRLLVGLIALVFVARISLGALRAATPRQAQPSWWTGSLWGGVSGFTSFVAHAGNPPLQVYTLPLRMDPWVFTGTSVVFFAVVNLSKVVPYAMLGQFDAKTLWSGLVMFPLAAVSVLLGAALVKRMRMSVFYPFMYAMVALVGCKLVWDGAVGLSG